MKSSSERRAELLRAAGRADLAERMLEVASVVEVVAAPQGGIRSEKPMRTQTITFEQWRREAPQQRAKIAPLLARLGPIVRDKPRDPIEAERLIGPDA